MAHIVLAPPARPARLVPVQTMPPGSDETLSVKQETLHEGAKACLKLQMHLRPG